MWYTFYLSVFTFHRYKTCKNLQVNKSYYYLELPHRNFVPLDICGGVSQNIYLPEKKVFEETLSEFFRCQKYMKRSLVTLFTDCRKVLSLTLYIRNGKEDFGAKRKILSKFSDHPPFHPVTLHGSSSRRVFYSAAEWVITEYIEFFVCFCKRP